jgi:hypothetical protein
MAGQFFEHRDERNARLHTVIAVIGRQLARLPAQPTDADDETLAELRAFWGEFVTVLALEPEHELRQCPSCKHVGMRAATRCGHCWITLVPPGSGVKTSSTDDVALRNWEDEGGSADDRDQGSARTLL